MKLTIKEFRKLYPDNAACLDKLFRIRYGNLDSCPECGHDTDFRRITTRQCYQCRFCYHQIYPCAGTIFEKSTTPLTYWFYAMWLIIVTRNGVSAKALERHLGVTYKTSWRMLHQIRKLMAGVEIDKLRGFVEVDETYVSKYKDRPEVDRKGKRGRVSGDDTTVVGMVERRGKVIAKAVKDAKKATIYPLINAHIDKTAIISTDEHRTYKNLGNEGYEHGIIRHDFKIYREGQVSTNTIEGYFSQLKRMIGGTHTWVSEKWLQNYINEACFRYNNRNKGNQMFNVLIECLNKEKTE